MRQNTTLALLVLACAMLAACVEPPREDAVGVEPVSDQVARVEPVRDEAAPFATKVRPARYPAFLPREAHAVLDAIAHDGPYAYRKDGSVFQNRERLLPERPRGYYREFTVPTPDSDDRGARRLVTGGDPPTEYFYTEDHYRSFRRFVLGTPERTR